MKNDIALELSYGIKNGKWIRISYLNSQNETTYYWIAIKDIDFKNKKLKCSIYNHEKSNDCLETYIKFKSIISAKVLGFTSYDVPDELYNKLEGKNLDSEWLKYETFNNNILEYFIECNELDNDPYQKEHCLIDGIDLDILLENKIYILNDNQVSQILNYIYHYDINKKEFTRNDLIISALSINDN